MRVLATMALAVAPLLPAAAVLDVAPPAAHNAASEVTGVPPATGAPPASIAPPASTGDSGVVQAWLESEGAEAIVTSEGSGLSAEALASVTTGPPVHVATWSEGFLAGDPEADPVAFLDRWIAPLLLDGDGIGALELDVAGSGVTGSRTFWDRQLGSQLARFQGATFLSETESGAWFRLSGELLTPINDAARNVLAGTIAVSDYQPFLVDRLGTDEPSSSASTVDGEPSTTPVVAAAVIMAGLLAIVGVTIWLRRPEGTS